MATCPRCEAENQPGRASCWNCWAPLPATPAEEAPAKSPTTDEAVQLPLQAPSLTTPDPPSTPRQHSSRRDGVTVWVGGPSEAADLAPEEPVRRGGGWAWGIIGFLAVVVLGLVLLWHYTFRPKAAASDFTEVAQAYVTALTVRDTQAQQQLATESSKGLLLPTWLTVASGSLQPSPGTAGSIRVMLLLSPAPTHEVLPPKLVTAISRPYMMTLTLRQEPDGWRVDQRAFLAALKKTLISENPGVEFPAWE